MKLTLSFKVWVRTKEQTDVWTSSVDNEYEAGVVVAMVSSFYTYANPDEQISDYGLLVTEVNEKTGTERVWEWLDIEGKSLKEKFKIGGV